MQSGQLKLISVENPYESVDQTAAADAFSEVMKLRLHGYAPEYPKGLLPLDLPDFVCLHHLLCLPVKGHLTAVAGFRQVPLASIDRFGLEFSLLKVLREARAERHLKAIEDIIAEHRRATSCLTYASAIVIRKDLVDSKEFSLLFREITSALAYDDLALRWQSESICAGAMKFKVHLWLEQMGYEPLTIGGKALEPVPYTVAQDPVLLMHLKKPAAWSRECYDRHRALLDSRTWIRAPGLAAKAAA